MSFFRYTNGGFALMETLAANAILQEATGQSDAFIANTLMPMRTKDIVTDYFPLVLMPTMAFFVQLMYIPFLYRAIARIVGEKSSRARESMRMMGMSEASYWGSWIIYWTAINTTIAVLCTLIFIINVFQAEHGFAVFLFFWMFGQSLFGLLVIGQALFSNPKNAGATMSAIYFCTSLIQQLFIDENTPFGSKVAACWFFPTLSMINGSMPLANNFAVGRVANWTLRYQQFSVFDSIWLMIVGGLNLLIIGMYLEFALPKE
jgi:ATP-binding cassette subfamily A (ABC1) protein 3